MPHPHTGALIIRIGFWAHYTIIMIWNPPQNSIVNYLGPYIARYTLQGLESRVSAAATAVELKHFYKQGEKVS